MLKTTTSNGPISRSMRSVSATTSASRRASRPNANARPPASRIDCASASSCSRWRGRRVRQTANPSRAKARAIAAPNPSPAPTTSATPSGFVASAKPLPPVKKEGTSRAERTMSISAVLPSPSLRGGAGGGALRGSVIKPKRFSEPARAPPPIPLRRKDDRKNGERNTRAAPLIQGIRLAARFARKRDRNPRLRGFARPDRGRRTAFHERVPSFRQSAQPDHAGAAADDAARGEHDRFPALRGGLHDLRRGGNIGRRRRLSRQALRSALGTGRLSRSLGRQGATDFDLRHPRGGRKAPGGAGDPGCLARLDDPRRRACLLVAEEARRNPSGLDLEV